MWVLTLWAQAERANKDPFRQPEIIWGTAGLAVALLAGAFLIWAVDRWRKRSSDNRESAEELTDFRGMHQRGEITDEEYAKLRNKVAARMKAPAGSPPAADPANPPNPPPPA
jgi:hypothetical protein